MDADLVLYNGFVYDMVNPFPNQAIAIRAGRVLKAGSDQEILSLLSPEGMAIDLKGATAIPGLVDGHFHLLSYALRLSTLDLAGLDSKDKVLEKVAAKVSSIPKGQWVIGGGWDRNLWPDPSFPTRRDLDAVATNHPVALWSKDGHTLWLNSLALKELGINSFTPDPPGGVIERDELGQPTGILKEKAAELFKQRVEASSPLLQRSVEEAMESLLRKGLVGLHNCEDERALSLLQSLKSQGKLKMRILHHIPAENLEAAIKLGIKSGFGDEYLRIGGVKIFADGTLGSRTAAMLEPYLGEPENLGILTITPEELEELILKAGEAGLSVAVHAIGDRANRVVLDALEKAPRLRHRIEHVQLLTPQDLPRLAKLGVVASMQPIHATSDMEMAERYWGKERCRWAYAWRSLLEAGTILAFGSDCPVEPPDPLLGIYAAVTRRRLDGSPGPEGWFPEQRLTVEEAIRAYTWGNAFAAGEEKSRGTLAPGFLADITILSDDIFRTAPEKIPGIEVLGTIIGGEIAFLHPAL
jgi:hypothetical protein